MDKNMKIDEQIYQNLPEPLKQLTDLFEDRERDIVLLSCLGVLSGCLPKVYGIYGGSKVYSNLYFFIVAPAASGKGAVKYAIGLVKSIHEKIKNDSEQEAKDCKKNKDIDNDDCPGIKYKIIAGNTSSSQIYSSLADSHYGSIILESEADSITGAMTNDWGNFSDVLRKAFHHEKLSITRKKDNLNLEIDNPRLSMVLCGTPDQVKPLIQSKENGLFSRFMYFKFKNYSGWKDVFGYSEDVSKHFESIGNDCIYPLYGKLFQNPSEIEFKFSLEQMEYFNNLMTHISDSVVENNSEDFISNVRRHGLILFRIAMVLTVIRNYSNDNLDLSQDIICNNVDYDIAASLTKNLLRHALQIFSEFNDTLLNQQEDDLLFSLNETFMRKEAIEKAEKFGIPERTMDEKLKQWRKKKVIRKIKHGKYKRVLG
ncbi:DUF3987 domain-containing protein [Mangrovimonas cancribranchiae]|uniref:DUF3987 domain-containing protein n=1 Tax=Mangrovimonas cancribranchiae TaxID=3080055 RepID=A0AAU6P0L6_9FLAO